MATNVKKARRRAAEEVRAALRWFIRVNEDSIDIGPEAVMTIAGDDIVFSWPDGDPMVVPFAIKDNTLLLRGVPVADLGAMLVHAHDTGDRHLTFADFPPLGTSRAV